MTLGYGVWAWWKGEILGFSTDLRRRPYKHSPTTVECVITSCDQRKLLYGRSRYVRCGPKSHLLFCANHCHCCSIRNDWSFDEGMAKYGCEVHSFDPRSMTLY